MSLDIRLPEIDALMALYKENPGAFEELRQQLLRQAVDRAPKEQRPALEALLQQIDATRHAASSPTESMLLAFKLMQESLTQLQRNWDEARYGLAKLQTSLVIERVRRPDPR